jgi:DNA invertase Pin-like site-specific DNA recombinase
MSKSRLFVTSGQEKIRANHLQGVAYIYLRQSSPTQVLHHRESQINQERMADRARILGWHEDQIKVIRTDLGQSGREITMREGFRKLLSEVSLGHVGIVLGYEVSRFSRNNSDWYRLLEAVALFDTLIADYDGVYDLNLFNDRLLLGLKGAMSEAELHLMKLRLDAGRKRQLERGTFRLYLPTGYVRLDDGTVIKDPNERVRHVFDLIFQKFRDLPSCTKVLEYFAENDILVPRRQVSGIRKGEMLWRPAQYAFFYQILTIPTYAGTLVYGRKTTQSATLTRLIKPHDEWQYVHQDSYPAYITWQEYLGNQEKLRTNRPIVIPGSASGMGASRQGNALLQGLVYCGKCGHRLGTAYKPYGKYRCGVAKRQFGKSVCDQFRAEIIDKTVVNAFFDAIQPAQLNILAQVMDAQDQDYVNLKHHWQLRIQQATYDAQRAQRQYDAVDPDNRLVAVELERRWEASLTMLKETEQAFEDFEASRTQLKLTPELRNQFQHICHTLPDLWEQLEPRDKKDLLRSLIRKVIVTRIHTDQVKVKIVWISGYFSEHSTWISVHTLKKMKRYDQLVARIHSLWEQKLNDEDIAKQLTDEGFTSARQNFISKHIVLKIRHQYRWLTSSSPKIDAPEGFIKVNELAQRLDVSQTWIYKRIRNGMISSDDYERYSKRGVILIRNLPPIIEKIQQMKQT